MSGITNVISNNFPSIGDVKLTSNEQFNLPDDTTVYDLLLADGSEVLENEHPKYWEALGGTNLAYQEIILGTEGLLGYYPLYTNGKDATGNMPDVGGGEFTSERISPSGVGSVKTIVGPNDSYDNIVSVTQPMSMLCAEAWIMTDPNETYEDHYIAIFGINMKLGEINNDKRVVVSVATDTGIIAIRGATDTNYDNLPVGAFDNPSHLVVQYESGTDETVYYHNGTPFVTFDGNVFNYLIEGGEITPAGFTANESYYGGSFGSDMAIYNRALTLDEIQQRSSFGPVYRPTISSGSDLVPYRVVVDKHTPSIGDIRPTNLEKYSEDGVAMFDYLLADGSEVDGDTYPILRDKLGGAEEDRDVSICVHNYLMQQYPLGTADINSIIYIGYRPVLGAQGSPSIIEENGERFARIPAGSGYYKAGWQETIKTMECILRINSPSSNQATFMGFNDYFSKNTSNDYATLRELNISGTRLYAWYRLYGQSKSGVYADTGVDLVLGEWTHISFCWNSTDAFIHVNGILAATLPGGNTGSNSSLKFFLGVFDTQLWNGLACDIYGARASTSTLYGSDNYEPLSTPYSGLGVTSYLPTNTSPYPNFPDKIVADLTDEVVEVENLYLIAFKGVELWGFDREYDYGWITPDDPLIKKFYISSWGDLIESMTITLDLTTNAVPENGTITVTIGGETRTLTQDDYSAGNYARYNINDPDITYDIEEFADTPVIIKPSWI